MSFKKWRARMAFSKVECAIRLYLSKQTVHDYEFEVRKVPAKICELMKRIEGDKEEGKLTPLSELKLNFNAKHKPDKTAKSPLRNNRQGHKNKQTGG
jgi:predicted transcriptional regulator